MLDILRTRAPQAGVSPMLDVHPPHEAAHSWKDFLIHIATIVIGLVIAVGLEQAVELIHHHHQRQQLESDLHAESLRNLHIALDNISIAQLHLSHATSLYAQLQHLDRNHGPLLLDESMRGLMGTARPATAAWTTAQQNATLSLLPHQVAQKYTRLYSVAEMVSVALDKNNISDQAFRAASSPAVLDPSTLSITALRPRSYDAAALDPEDLRTLRNALAAQIQQLNSFCVYNTFLYGGAWAAARGSLSDQDTIRIIYDADSVFAHHGEAALLAKYPLPAETQPTSSPSTGEAN